MICLFPVSPCIACFQFELTSGLLKMAAFKKLVGNVIKEKK